MKPVLFGAALLVAVALAGALRFGSAPAVPQQPASQTQKNRTRDDFGITPVEMPDDDLRQLLGARLWKFKARPSRFPEDWEFKLQLLQPRTAPQLLAEGSFGSSEIDPADGTTLLLGVLPLGGDLTEAAKLKILMRRDGSSQTSILANPLRVLRGVGSSSPGAVGKDGRIVLIEFSRRGRFPDPQSSRLVLTLAARPSQP